MVVLTYRTLHRDAAGCTYTAEWLWLRLEYAFGSPALMPRVVGCEVVSNGPVMHASDHLPLRVVLS